MKDEYEKDFFKWTQKQAIFLQKGEWEKLDRDHLKEDAYFTARLEASSETRLDEKIFPQKCPWSLSEILT